MVETKYKLTCEELSLFYKEITNLCCELKESDGVKLILDQVMKFQKDADELEKDENCCMEKLEKCIVFGDSICIELPKLNNLKQVSGILRSYFENSQQTHWFIKIPTKLCLPQRELFILCHDPIKNPSNK